MIPLCDADVFPVVSGAFDDFFSSSLQAQARSGILRPSRPVRPRVNELPLAETSRDELTEQLAASVVLDDKTARELVVEPQNPNRVLGAYPGESISRLPSARRSRSVIGPACRFGSLFGKRSRRVVYDGPC